VVESKEFMNDWNSTLATLLFFFSNESRNLQVEIASNKSLYKDGSTL
jgi:hypothetical protein